MGRAHHLKETLPQNIRDNPSLDGVDVEFVVLNYNSQDDLHEWMMNDPEMQGYMASGALRYGKTSDPEHFHMSHAKNMVHRIAEGDVLCNVDADNFIGHGFAAFLENQFSKDMDIILNPSHAINRSFSAEDRGFFGRVVISKDNFYKLSGYDEGFQGWGGEDNDFVRRSQALGLKHFRFEDLKYLETISHSDEERVENMQNSDGALQKVEFIKNRESVLSKVMKRVSALAKPIQANDGGAFGLGYVDMEGERPRLLEGVTRDLTFNFQICALALPELIRGRIAPRIAEVEEEASDFSLL